MGFQEMADQMDEVAWHSRSKRPCLHVSLSPEKQDHLSKGDWAIATANYARGMGLDAHQLVVYLHHDATYPDGSERTHAHLVINLVGADGRQADVYGNYYRSQEVIRGIEQDLGLEHRPSWWQVARDKAIAKEHQKYSQSEIQPSAEPATTDPDPDTAPAQAITTGTAPDPHPDTAPNTDTASPTASSDLAQEQQQQWVEVIAPQLRSLILKHGTPCQGSALLEGETHTMVWHQETARLAIFENGADSPVMVAQHAPLRQSQWHDLGSKLTEEQVEYFKGAEGRIDAFLNQQRQLEIQQRQRQHGKQQERTR